MDSGRFLFDSSSASNGHMLLLGSGGSADPIFRSGGRSLFGIVEESGGGSGASNKRRPFFTSPEDLFDEEYYDEQLPEKKRRLTAEQVHMLERSFEAENKLEPERKSELARNLGLQPRQVAVWFQNRRARWKTKQLEGDYDRLKSSYDSLLADRDALLKDNDLLRSQAIALTERLQQRELEVATGLIKEEDNVGSNGDLSALNVGQQKAEAGLSSGSGGSAVVEGDDPQHLVMDSSGESYFPEDAYNLVQGGTAGGGVQSEDDDVSDEGCSYYPNDVFAAEHQPQEEEDAQFGLWIWS